MDHVTLNVVIANVAENGLDGAGLEPLRAAAAAHQLEVLVFCAPLEAEIATLDAEAQAGFLKDYGIAEPARARHVADFLAGMTDRYALDCYQRLIGPSPLPTDISDSATW